MRLRDQYDWVVLGDHPAALLSAGMVARLGLSVLVLPVAPSSSFRLSERGQAFDPESNFLLGARNLPPETSLVAQCLGRAGLAPAEEALFRAQGNSPQVITPLARLQLLDGDGEFDLECAREFGPELSKRSGLSLVRRESSSAFLRHWAELPQRLTWNPREKRRKGAPVFRIGDLRKGLAKSSALEGSIRTSWYEGRPSSAIGLSLGRSDLTETFQGLWYAISSSVGEDPSLSAILELMVLARAGASFKGGMTAYRDLLLRLARRSGAQCPEATECRRIFVQDGRFVGVQVSHQGNMISCVGAALGCTLDHALPKVSSSGKAFFRRAMSSPTPTGWKFTVALTVHAEAIPPGMALRSVWQERGAPPLEVEVADPLDYGIREPDAKIIYLRTVLPFDRSGLDPTFQRLMATRMFRKLTEIVPFLEYHVIRMYPDFRSSRTTGVYMDLAEAGYGELKEVYPYTDPAEIPGNLRVYCGSGLGSHSGMDGVFLTSNEAFPEYGSMGAVVAAVEGTAWIAHRSGLQGPFG